MRAYNSNNFWIWSNDTATGGYSLCLPWLNVGYFIGHSVVICIARVRCVYTPGSWDKYVWYWHSYFIIHIIVCKWLDYSIWHGFWYAREAFNGNIICIETMFEHLDFEILLLPIGLVILFLQPISNDANFHHQ